MPAHEISMELPEPTVVNKDVVIKVKSGGKALGKLQISKGTVDWWPAHSTVNHYKVSWEKLAQLLEAHGTPAKKG